MHLTCNLVARSFCLLACLIEQTMSFSIRPSVATASLRGAAQQHPSMEEESHPTLTRTDQASPSKTCDSSSTEKSTTDSSTQTNLPFGSCPAHLHKSKPASAGASPHPTSLEDMPWKKCLLRVFAQSLGTAIHVENGKSFVCFGIRSHFTTVPEDKAVACARGSKMDAC